MSTNQSLIAVALIFLAAIVYGIFQIIWAVECGQAGGAYIIPQSGFPVCVQGVMK